MKVHVSSHGVAIDSSRPSDDAWKIREREGVLVAALADGMGSARHGGEAARRAVDMITDYYLGRPQSWSPRRALTEFAARINRLLYLEAQTHYGAPELMCTLSVVALEGGMLFGLNVGDSPVFLQRRGAPLQLSETHVLAEPGMDHVLTRALGASADLEPFTFETPLEDGDMIVLCSDGVSRAIPPPALDELLTRHATARTLVAAAQDATREHPDRADDASAIALEVRDRGWSHGHRDRAVEVLEDLQAGMRVDELTLVRPLQDGGRVWEARDEHGARMVAKFPALEARDDEARRDAFVREAWQASRIEGPEFVRASIPTGGTLRYYTMEFVDAPTLRAVLQAGTLGVEQVIALAGFLLRSAQALLEHDIVHGDIKPENILVVGGRPDHPLRFKLLDLGSAGEVFSNTTRAGTASYLAPERFHGAAAAERTEVFAIGVTLYEAATGTYPFGEIERFQTPRFDHAPKRPSRLKPAVPAWLEAVLLRALSPEAGARYQAYSEMLFDLEHPEQVEPFHRKDSPLIERNPLLFYKLLCALLAGIVGLLVWQLAHR